MFAHLNDPRATISVRIPNRAALLRAIQAPAPVAEEEVYVIKKGINPKLRSLAINLWITAGIMAVKAKSYAAAAPTDTGLWDGMLPMFQLFQEVAMVVGSLAIIAGLILLIFKKRWGVTTVKTAAIIVGGVFLVPAAVMLLAIIGNLFNDRLVEVMKHIKH